MNDGAVAYRQFWGLMPEKWIMFSLRANGTMRSVSGIYPQIISQGENLFHNALYQLLMVTTGKIGPSNGTGEEGITRKHHSRCVKAHPAR